MIQRVNFINRGSMQNMIPLPTWAAVSISEQTETKLKHGWYAIHRSFFHDVDPLVNKTDEPHVLMNATHAENIVAFVESVAPYIDVMFVNCMGGISRSAAVAKWVAERFSLPFDQHYAPYNKHVYKLMCEAGQRYKDKNNES
ncbi:hypothetical protein GALL_362880 [mine drainage metagenome]|uniref:Tyrosine specific protein phosphatases domain-containing protein n=1 Tax=mine drainage metagenome TaxID=410659 RepID=A0A1J5QEE6_9ZZZZ